MFNLIDLASGWKVDFIVRKDREISSTEFLRRVRVVDESGFAVTVATPEDVIISKLEWSKNGGSERQIQDASAIIRSLAGGLDRTYIEFWIRDLGLQAQWAQACDLAAV